MSCSVTPVRLEPGVSRSLVKHSTTEPLRSLFSGDIGFKILVSATLSSRMEQIEQF